MAISLDFCIISLFLSVLLYFWAPSSEPFNHSQNLSGPLAGASSQTVQSQNSFCFKALQISKFYVCLFSRAVRGHLFIFCNIFQFSSILGLLAQNLSITLKISQVHWPGTVYRMSSPKIVCFKAIQISRPSLSSPRPF